MIGRNFSYIIVGILILNPKREANDVTSIGPRNQARGILKNSAIIALGIDIMMTKTNCLEKIC